MRLVKFLARAGVASRRHAEQMISGGRVSVDGERVTDPARDVDEDHDVRVDGKPVRLEPLEHHMLHKPVGVVSTAHDPQGRPKVVDLVRSSRRLYPVGRLDFGSSGLIVLTNDGDLANLMMHPRHEIEKTYRVVVAGFPDELAFSQLREGVELEDGLTAPARAELVERARTGSVVEISIHEGRKHQVRRMCDAVGHPAQSLKRIAIGPLRLGDLALGASRHLADEEVGELRRVASNRS